MSRALKANLHDGVEQDVRRLADADMPTPTAALANSKQTLANSKATFDRLLHKQEQEIREKRYCFSLISVLVCGICLFVIFQEETSAP